MTTPEGAVKKEIRTYLTQIGAYQFWPVQMGYGATTVDGLVCYKGWFVAIEVKRPDTRPKPTPRQLTRLDEIKSAGGWTIIAYDVNDVQELIKRIDRHSNGQQ